MKIRWEVDEADINRVKELWDAQSQNPFVHSRCAANLAAVKTVVTKERFWKALSAVRLTSVQKSGPHSAVATLIRKEPYPLRYEDVSASTNPAEFITSALSQHGGIRFHKEIGDDLGYNLALLESGKWQQVLDQCNRLVDPTAEKSVERQVANFIDDSFRGFGPKQSRTVLQSLGLTRYEIPIDSRVGKWLRQIEFPIPIDAALLGLREYYELVLDAVQFLCEKADRFPCEFDAAVFAEQEKGSWTERDVMEF